jgi:hypothetical protein
MAWRPAEWLSSRAVMENAKKFFEIVEKHLKEIKHEQCKLTDDDITEMVKKPHSSR